MDRFRLSQLILLLVLIAPLPATAGEQFAPLDVPLVMNQPYRINCGDNLEVVYALQNSVYRTNVIVRTDGMISLPLVDDVQAAGLRLDQLSVILREQYSAVFRYPRINVVLRHSTAARAFVGGEVDYAGIISLRNPVTVRQALIIAGGAKSTGALSRVVVVRKKSPTETAWFELDLTDMGAIEGEPGEFYLQAGDLVLVPMKNIAKVRLWIQQYIYQILSLHLTTEFEYLYRRVNYQ